MPTKPRTTTAKTPRTPRKKRPPAETCPVLAGFGQWSAEQATQAHDIPADSQADPPAIVPAPAELPVTPRVMTWPRLIVPICLVLQLLYAWHGPSRATSDNPAAIAVRNYAHSCDSQIVDAIRKKNDGNLTGEAVAVIIEQGRPTVDKAAWSEIANRLTALQTDDGLLPKAALDSFLDEMSAGLSSF